MNSNINKQIVSRNLNWKCKVGYGEVGRHSHAMPCTWWLSWLAVEALIGTGWAISLFFFFLTQIGVENVPLP